MDKATTEELLNFMLESIVMIEKRFSSIKTIDDFLNNDTGVQKLDSIAMRIQAIGEALKNLYKREKSFLLEVADSNYWSQIIRMRDILSHHYVDLNAEIIFEICDEKLDELKTKLTELKLHL